MPVRPCMVHLDATLRLFDPDIQTERALPCAGPSKRSLHFELGEVTRRRWNVMREAEGRAITIGVQIVEQRHFHASHTRHVARYPVAIRFPSG